MNFDLKWTLLSFLGAIIDSVFITIFYQIKYPVKRYNGLILILSSVAFTCYFMPNTIIMKMILVIPFLLIPIIHTKNIKNIFYILIPYLFLGIMQFAVYSLMSAGDLSFALNYVICSFLIIAVFEDKDFKVEFKFLDITLKVIFLIFVILILSLSKYYYLEKGGF